MSETVKLNDVVTIIGGGTPSKNEASYWKNGNIKWATVGDMNVHTIVDTELSITDKGLRESSSNIVSKDAIVIATRVGLGKVCFLKDDTAINQDLKGLLPNPKRTTKEYLYYFFKSISDYIIENGTGATVKGVKLDFIKDIDVPLPPLTEQQRIVEKLDQLFEKIDKAIALHQKNIDEADAFMGSALNEVFGELEEKYEHTKLKDVVTKDKRSIKRGPFGSALKKSFFVDSGYLVYEQYHALNNDFSMERYFIDEEKFNELDAFEVKGGDIIISCSGVYLGKLAIVPENCTKGIINQALLKLTLDRLVVIDKLFVFFWNNLINNGFFDEVKKGAAIPNMPSVAELKEIGIPLPPLPIQQKVVTYLDDLSDKIERVKTVQKGKMDSLKALKASILDKAFRGQL